LKLSRTLFFALSLFFPPTLFSCNQYNLGDYLPVYVSLPREAAGKDGKEEDVLVGYAHREFASELTLLQQGGGVEVRYEGYGLEGRKGGREGGSEGMRESKTGMPACGFTGALFALQRPTPAFGPD
jgi:hypothetical protein